MQRIYRSLSFSALAVALVSTFFGAEIAVAGAIIASGLFAMADAIMSQRG